MGDALTGGATQIVRKAMGVDAVVDKSSAMYAGGRVAGKALDVAITATGAGGIAKGLAKQALTCGVKQAAKSSAKIAAQQAASMAAAKAKSYVADKVTEAAANSGVISEENAATVKALVDVSNQVRGYAATLASTKVASEVKCFPAGTLVALYGGGKTRIEDIAAGCVVSAFDTATGEVVPGEVARVFRGVTDRWVDITVDGETITATPAHPFWLPGGHSWVPAEKIVVGDELLLEDGRQVRVESVSIRVPEGPEPTYNFEVAGTHDYFVGKHSVLVHNKCPGKTDSARRLKDNAIRGRASEKRVLNDIGETKNTAKVSGREGNSVPDYMNDNTIGEIKDTRRVVDSKQLRIQREAAKKAGKIHEIRTGRETKVSDTVLKQSEVIRRDDLGPR
jgi:hypothetical protein